MRRMKKARSSKKSPSHPWRRLIWQLVIVALIILAGWVVYLDAVVTSKFEGRRWEVPSRVFARPLEIYDGAPISVDSLRYELDRLGYEPVRLPSEPGSYSRSGGRFTIYTRAFRFPDGEQPARQISLTINGDRVQAFQVRKGPTTRVMRLEPVQVGGIYPSHGEDRVLVSLDEAPALFREALLSTEDEDFFDHWGIAPLSILRALWANIQAGHVVQGGSTLTQQLVKNFYLTRDQTLVRKANEAIMALLLEAHYEKNDILETYLNEVYLGQAGSRAIHGFGLGSQFYFGESFRRLDLHEVALLVAVIKGPSYFDPRRHPERARERRNLVIRLMEQAGHISRERADQAQARSLDVVDRPSFTGAEYPAYLDLVQRHLSRDYRQEDLQSEGLRIFTTLNPAIQRSAENAVAERLARLNDRSEKTLESAVVVTSRDSGEVVALVGGRESQYDGFNRAVDARRPIGSLMKPFVFLSALSRPEDYTLVTPLKDRPFALVFDNGREWKPENYSGEAHGEVPLHRALSHSYNLASVRLGLGVGVPAVRNTLDKLGLARDIPTYPSMLLGAASLSPVEVASLYQGIATGGFNTPLRTIREVTTAGGESLSRYGLEVKQVVDPAAVHLVQYAMQEVMQEGTGKSAYRYLPRELGLAGKTGTTNDGRDSWFAGFSGDLLAVSWVGRDDNGPTPLTGATGALPVWADLMSRIPQNSFSPVVPAEVNYHWVDSDKAALTEEGCGEGRYMPFIAGSEPTDRVACSGSLGGQIRNWLRSVF
ncbi:penicillin-binding protein 1B [Tamilnaduibacter salinus]|uniref:Penicillin-binding protein 1B n=1 Tax=Tamilnaduibacter salinus TaxID=1484056 RepID=A0A2A2I7Z3_9GAMM|nr:penicillin-binding protein 1B [Tamilnaduibacter salinus]PAV27508.1 penicillin-binding protein 1B [Tamilnaduibacter salinus]PVY77045.1 penicillin-binding protein 1B [Tamilnaduibacter salinus]